MGKKKLAIISVSIATAISLVAGMAVPALAQGEQGTRTKVPPARAINGKVTEIDPGKTFFVVQVGQDKTVKISVDAETKYFKVSVPRKLGEAIKERVQQAMPKIEKFAPGLKQKPALQGKPDRLPPMPQVLPGKLDELAKLRHLGEEATFDDIAVDGRVMVRVVAGTDNPLAKVVLIVEPVTFKNINGKITVLSGDSVTIEGDETVTVTVDENTEVVIKGATALAVGQTAHAVYNADTKVAKLIRAKGA